MEETVFAHNPVSLLTKHSSNNSAIVHPSERCEPVCFQYCECCVSIKNKKLDTLFERSRVAYSFSL